MASSQFSDVAYDACRVPFNDNLFVIGTFAAPISFASQQQRALNLVWGIQSRMALETPKPSLRSKKIAIVGAGVSGMTTAIACKSLGADVWLYEKDSDVLNRFNQASHRELHPTINFWPRRSLMCTTTLPFFNWHSNRCDTIMAGIRSEWKRLHKHPSSMVSNQTSHKVNSILSENKVWTLKGFNFKTNDEFSATDFDVLILAPGFGDEHGLRKYGTPCYWDSKKDLIEKFKDYEGDLGFKNFIISGNGDGGLIECFRLVFKNFVAGKLEKEFSAILNDVDIKSMILELETSNNTALSDIIAHEPDTREESDKKEQVSKDLWIGYSAIVESKMGGSAWKELFKELRREYIPKVVLLGTEITPMQFTASPFHRLLLTFCINQNWIEYYQLASSSNLKHLDCDKLVNAFAKSETREIEFDYIRKYSSNHLSKVSKKRKSKFSKSKCFYLARVGFFRSVESILLSLGDSSLLGHVRRQQANLTKYTGIDKEALKYFSLKIGKQFEFGSILWAGLHFEVAKDYLWEKFGIELADNREEPIYDGMISMDKEAQERYDEMKEFMPTEFYGVKINVDGIGEPATFGARGVSG